MKLISIALSAIVVVGATLQPLVLSSNHFVVKEKHHLPPKWRNIGSPDPLHMIDLQIGLKQGNFEELEYHLHQISDPDHARYGQYLSKDEVDTLVKPTPETSAQVATWLSNNGIGPKHQTYSSGGDWVSVTVSVSAAESLLDTKYSIYQHEDGIQLLRTTSWSLPRDLHDLIVTIQPTTSFLRASPHGVIGRPSQEIIQIPRISDNENADVAPACNFSAVTTGCLRNLYRTITYTPKVPGQSKIGFTNYLGEFGGRLDAATFLSRYRPEAESSAYSHQSISIKGGPTDNGTNHPGIEGNLDLETILGLVWPIPTTSYSTGGSPPFLPDKQTKTNSNEPYLSWVNYALSLNSTTLPQVISTSYGDDEQTVPYAYANAVCNQFAQLGARGVTLFFSSGDYGVGPNGSCILTDGHNTTAFLPAFPASCPYVTAVGGTRSFPEVVAFNPRNGYASGSGFSNYFPRPDWQHDVVKKYLPTVPKKFKNLYNATGRAYPDVAAQGYQFVIVYNNNTYRVDGTSCSSPAISSVFALVNDALLAQGRPTLGWLNPWLYKKGYQGFTDVLSGSSVGCDGKGFQARKGWDVASGWGTPDFEKVLDVLGVNPPAAQEL